MKMGTVISIGIVCMCITGLIVDVIHRADKEPEFTCEVAAERLWAVRQCLKFQPSCPSLSVEGFADYHQIRHWSNANCPDMDSGGDFLSQSTTNE